MPGVLDPQKVPTFICQSLLTCRRLCSDGSSDPPTNQITDLAFAHLVGLGNHWFHTPVYVWQSNEAATFT